MKNTLLLLTLTGSMAHATFSVSGISSGGFMAAQLGVIYSADVNGVATVAGGFYGCAQDHLQKQLQLAKFYNINLVSLLQTEVNPQKVAKGQWKDAVELAPQNPLYQALTICMKAPEKSTLRLDVLEKNSASGKIDPLQNLTKQRVLVYQGQGDTVVQPGMKEKLTEFYRAVHVPDSQVKVVEGPGGHNFPTDRTDMNSCEAQSVPYVSSCGLNLAEDILEHMTARRSLNRSTDRLQNLQSLRVVSQKLGSESPPPSMASYGYLAASNYCLENPSQCELHVAFHGCEMSDSFDHDFDRQYAQSASMGYLRMRNKKETLPFSPLPFIEQRQIKWGLLKFAANSGYLDYVQKNKLMVLFPQTWITEDNYPLNPKGCWDWYGWTGSDYATKQGAEPKWLHKWIRQVQQSPKRFVQKKPIDFTVLQDK